MLPDTRCDAYETILRAGELHQQARALEHEASVLEGLARMQLQRERIPETISAQHPGTVLCLAYTGAADGQITRAPFEAMMQLKIMANAPATDGGLALVQLFDYEPALIVKVGPYVVGALVMPKGVGLQHFFDELRAPPPASGYRPVALAMARMLTLAVGFNADMVQDIVGSAVAGSLAFDNAPDTPMFAQLAPSA